MGIQYLHIDRPFVLESGESLPELTIAYHTFGQRREDNVVWVCHALTANSDVADWWPGTVEAGRFLDPAVNFTVCANILGSHYGTTGPLSTDPCTGQSYYDRFPRFTIRDIVLAHILLADHLKIDRIKAVIGSSIGGFQAMEMAVSMPGRVEKAVLIATSAYAKPWAIAFNQSQRMAIEADCTYGAESSDAGAAGMAAARSIGLLSYRGPVAYNRTQADPPDAAADFRAISYQRYQGEKLRRRFNAYSYHRLTTAFDSHNVGRMRGGIERALTGIDCPVLIVGITTDLIFPLEDQKELYNFIPGSRFEVIESDFGHDGFLVEADKLDSVICPFINTTDN